jgi:hypothetical protein
LLLRVGVSGNERRSLTPAICRRTLSGWDAKKYVSIAAKSLAYSKSYLLVYALHTGTEAPDKFNLKY